MAKILVIDDEQGYRRQLEIALCSDGHEVRTASSGREGIDVGARFRPQILITDWMLKDDIHGLHVGRVLRAVCPFMRVILITGFPTHELREDADRVLVGDFIEKPFTLDRIRAAIAAAGQPDGFERRVSLAIIEINGDGRILYANEAANEAFRDTLIGGPTENLNDYFRNNPPPDLKAARDRWIVASPDAERRIFWHFRCEDPIDRDSQLIVLRPGSGPLHEGSALIEMLLGSRDMELPTWPLDGRVLIIDHDTVYRNLAVSMLENGGAGCYAVSTVDDALPLLENDDGIQCVMMRHEPANPTEQRGFDAIRAVRSDITIVGICGPDSAHDVPAGRFEHVLCDTWRLEDVSSILTGRLGNCLNCGLRLPLRRPRDDEEATSWACSHCGAHYHAVFDSNFPPDVLRNAHSAETGSERRA
jgi:DNA-binding response OmpR family regulator